MNAVKTLLTACYVLVKRNLKEAVYAEEYVDNWGEDAVASLCVCENEMRKASAKLVEGLKLVEANDKDGELVYKGQNCYGLIHKLVELQDTLLFAYSHVQSDFTKNNFMEFHDYINFDIHKITGIATQCDEIVALISKLADDYFHGEHVK